MMNPESIGAFIRQIRKEKGTTQEQLAELPGASQRSVSRWENGKTMPEMIIPLVSGWFVWGFGLLLSVKIRKAVLKLEKR